MTANKGKYSGNERLDPKTMTEPDQDNDFTRKMWLEEVAEDPEFLDDIKEQVDEWKKAISMTTDPDKLEIHLVGQSHIDVAWKWRYEQTRQKSIKTFEKAVLHAKTFADSKHNFCFALSEPLLLDWVLEDKPELFKEVQECVKSGGIELVGGSYVEPDCMMPSGEAFVRSRLYGQRFCQKHFGQLAEVEWFLDSFGYNVGLPQILAKSGSKAFWTSKITWNRQTIFPFVNFWWEGPDGTRLLTANFKMGMAGISDWIKWEMGRHPLLPDGRKVWDYTYDYGDIDEHVEEDEIIPHCGCFFGKGDGGHGPTHQEVAAANGWEDLGFAKWSRVGTFFDEIRKYGDRIPVWKDELYLEYHRGTFSVHAEVKRHNRYYENALTGLETLSMIAVLSNPKYKYPFDKIEKNWKIVLLNQFHDVLPGSSIPEVYDDVYDYWVEQDAMIADIKTEIGENLVEGADNAKPNELILNLFNPVAWKRTSPVFISVDTFGDSVSLDDNGLPPYAKLVFAFDSEKSYIAQPVAAEPSESAYPRSAGWWVVPELNAISCTTAKLILSTDGSEANAETNVSADGETITNGIVTVKIDPKTGAMLEMSSGDINNGSNLLKGEESNLNFGFLDDFPHDHAWNIKPEYWKYPLDDMKNDDSVSVKVTEKGPVFATIEISRILGKDKSPVTQKIKLFKDYPSVYLEWLADWKQPFVMLKILYSTATNAEKCVSDQAYCALERKTQPETPCDKARYEKIMHKYVDLSTPDNNWGIAMLNEGKYAYDTMGEPGNMRLTMLRSPRYPTSASEAWVNEERDMNKEKYGHEIPEFVGLGAEKCRYALLPHNGGSFVNADGTPNGVVKQYAEEFNQPVMVIPGIEANINNKTFGTGGESIVEILTPNVCMGALKLNEWEKNGNIILRVVEGSGMASTAEIQLHPKLNENIKSIKAVDLLERPIESALNWDKSSGKLTFDIKKFEICTFELEL